VATKLNFCTILIPDFTLPKIVCFPKQQLNVSKTQSIKQKKILPSSQGVGAKVIKNCDMFVFGPEFAITRIYQQIIKIKFSKKKRKKCILQLPYV
jgi:hypothetical protein